MDLVLGLQESAGWLTPAMRAVSHLGDQEFYLLAFPLLYWCVSPRLGLRMGVLLLVSGGLNGALKLAAATPRPYWLDGAVVPGALEASFGVPSGHAQNGVAFWGLLAHRAGRAWAWAAAGLLVLALGVSRVHLGVHFTLDVVVGWAAGALLLVAFLALERPVTAWLGRLGVAARLGVSLAAGLVLLVAGTAALLAREAFVVPAAWVEAALAAGHAELAPLSVSGVATPAGALAGLGIGLVALQAGGGFAVAAPGWRVAARYPLGVAGVVLLWLGLRALLPAGDDAVAVAARFLRYAAIGAWISGVAPLLFVRLRLAAAAQPTRAATTASPSLRQTEP